MSIIIKKRGFTLIETVIYIAGMVVLILAITGIIYSVYSWYKTATIGARVDRAGISIADQIIREIQKGSSVNSAQSVLNNNNGSLSFQTLVSGSTVTDYIASTSGRIYLQKNGGSKDYLSPTDFTISKMKFNQINTANSIAIRFEIGISYSVDNATSTKVYKGLAIMKNSYD